MQENKEHAYTGSVTNGFAMLPVVLLLIPAIVAAFFIVLPFELYWIAAIAAGIGFIGFIILSCGFFILQPNQSRVMIFFGKYRGTFRRTGYFWVNPFMTENNAPPRLGD